LLAQEFRVKQEVYSGIVTKSPWLKATLNVEESLKFRTKDLSYGNVPICIYDALKIASSLTRTDAFHIVHLNLRSMQFIEHNSLTRSYNNSI
jgi:hypothetical protein